MARPPAEEANGRARLVEAAWEALLHHGGPDGRISVATICAAARCTPPTLYHHFADLPDLLLAAGRRAFDAWAIDIDARVGDEPDPRRRLRTRAEAYVDWARANPLAYRAMFGVTTGSTEPGPAFDSLLRDVAGLLGVRPDHPGVMPAALAHWAAVHGVASLANSAPAVQEDLWKLALDRLVSALVGEPFAPGAGDVHVDGDQPLGRTGQGDVEHAHSAG
jgi:AcrR family transcriptional regulator